MNISEYITGQGWTNGSTLNLALTPDGVTPRFVAVLRSLAELGLAQETTLMALLGQAPIDPLRLLAPLGKRLGGWTLNPNDATLLAVLAKVGAQPVALCVADLLSSRVSFVALRDGSLTELSTHEPDALVDMLRSTGTVQGVIDRLEPYLQAAVHTGTGRNPAHDGGPR